MTVRDFRKAVLVFEKSDGNGKTGAVYRKTVRDFTKAVLVSKNTMGNGKPALFFEKQCGI